MHILTQQEVENGTAGIYAVASGVVVLAGVALYGLWQLFAFLLS